MRTLEDAVERIYSAFANVPRPTTIDSCPCCNHDRYTGRLISTPLREISAADLDRYVSSVFFTVGSREDFLYLLPRILDLFAENPDWNLPESVGRAIGTSQLSTWTGEQRAALGRYAHSMISCVMNGDWDHLLESWLCAVVRMGFEVHPFLRQIEKSRRAVLMLFDSNATTIAQRKLTK